MITAQTFKKIHEGFTLIELLIVIAVLGVLASVVLVAIDPLEQIARANDSGRESTVAQLGHAMQAYMTGQALAAPPTPTGTWSTAWQTNLQTAGEIKSTYTAPTGGLATCTTNAQTGYCYALQGTTDFVIWTFMASKSSIDVAAGAAAVCPASNFPAAVYASSLGKAGLMCITAAQTPAPTAATLF